MTVPNIVEFEARYADQVKTLFTTVLQYLGLAEEAASTQTADEPTWDDSDLDRVAEVYVGRNRFWVAVLEDYVVGMVAIQEVDVANALLRRMFVAPEYHGTGLGQRLFDTALNFARAQDFRAIHLETHQDMKRAHAFYEKNGFKQVGEEAIKRHYTRKLVS